MLQWESSNKYYILWVCICSLRCAACKAHAPCCHLWNVQLLSILAHYLINCETVVTEQKFVFWFSLQLSSERFLILRTERNMIKKCTLVFVWSTRYSCPITTELEFSRRIFEKCSDVMKIRPVGAELFLADRRTNGRTDIYDEANSHFLEFCERV